MAYRRSYGRRYKRRAVARVRTVTGRTASFVKLPSYKNLAYRGNERSGILHEIKFVKQIPLDFTITQYSEKNYAFLYIDCMAELISSEDFLKYAQQFQDYCPYAVTVSAACPVSLVGNSLLTNRLYDWPYFSSTLGVQQAVQNKMQLNNSLLGQYLINAGQFYPVASLPENTDYPVTLQTFDSFFASHSTSKKLWNANIPYGVRYARYYATSAQKAQVNNILQDAIVDYQYNDLPENLPANVQSDVGSINLLYKTGTGKIQCLAMRRSTVQEWTRDSNTNATIYPVRVNDISAQSRSRDWALYSYLWSLQRSRKGQFNPFYYVGVNLNQTHLSTDNALKQVLTLTFKFYVYFKNEITSFFTGVTGSANPGTGSTKATATVSIIDIQAQRFNQLSVSQQSLLQRSISNFRSNRMYLNYVNNSVASQLVQLTIPEILRQGLQKTDVGNYLLGVLRDDPTLFAAERNGFIIDESCYDSSTGKYTFQGYIDLLPNGNSSTLYLNKYEPDAQTTDSKFITNYGSDVASSALQSTFQAYNAAYTCPYWHQLVTFSDYNETFTSKILSYTSLNPTELIYASGFTNPIFGGDTLINYVTYLTSTLNSVLNYTQTVANVYNLNPVLYGMINGSHLRVLNPFKLMVQFSSDQYITDLGSKIGCIYEGDSSVGNYRFVSDDSRLATEVYTIIRYISDILLNDHDNPDYQANLTKINTCIDFGSTFLDADDFNSSIIFMNMCIPLGTYSELDFVELVSQSFDDSGTANQVPMHSLHTFMSCYVKGSVYTNGQIAVLFEFIKDFVYQGQNYLAASLFNGFDPSTVDLSSEDFYLTFIQQSSYTSASMQGWYYNELDYQSALTTAQDSFLQNIPVTASKVWKKIKGFLAKAWSALKTIGPGLLKIAGGSVASAAIPGTGATVGAAMIKDGVKELLTNVSAIVVSGKKKTTHYIDGKLVSITKANSTGIVKVILTPGICPLTSAEPVDLDSSQFVDQDSYQVSSVDIGDYTESRATSVSFRHSSGSLSSVRVTDSSGEEVDAQFYQARMKVQVYMDKPSQDFILPKTFIGITCDTQATIDQTA